MKKAFKYFLISFCLFFSYSYADEIHGVASIALQGTSEIIKSFEKQSGIKVNVEWLPSVDITKKLVNGDKMDFVFYPSKPVQDFLKKGTLQAQGQAEIVQSGIGIGVPKSSKQENINSSTDFKNALLSAKTIIYATGPSGDHIESVIRQLGIEDTIKNKIKISSGFVGKDIEKGDGDIGFQQIPEILLVPGIKLLGPLPKELQKMTPFTIAAHSSTKNLNNTLSFISYLKQKDLELEYKKFGLEPVTN